MSDGLDNIREFRATVDHLHLVARLGRGALGEMFLAEDRVGGRLLAARLIPRAVTSREADSGRLRKALIPAAHLSHPHILPLRHLHDVWEVDEQARSLGVLRGTQLLLRDYIPGDNLRSWCEGLQHVDPVAVAALFRDVASALDHAHAQGVVHGFLGPGDVIVTTEAGARIADLGVAAEVRLSLAAAGVLPPDLDADSPWTAPECVAGEVPGAAADVYSVGVLFAAALTRRWDVGVTDLDPTNILSVAQVEALKSCWAGDPAERPGSCSQALAAVVDECREDAVIASAAVGSQRQGALAEGRDAGESRAPPTGTADGGVGHGPAPGPAKRQAVAIVAGHETHGDSRESRPETPRAPAPPAAPLRSRIGTDSGGANWVNIGIGVAAVVLAVLLGVLLWQRRVHLDTGVESAAAWDTVQPLSRLSREFASMVTLADPGPDTMLRLRLSGQTRRLDVGVEGRTFSARETTGPKQNRLVAQAQLDRELAAGDVLTVVKSPDHIGLFLNGVRKIGVPWPLEEVVRAGWQAPPGAVPAASYRYQKIGPLVFADDFMHGEDELGAWRPQSGRWTVNALQNPIRSANAFSFLGQGDEALAVAGHWFWRDYGVKVAAHPLEGSAFGVVLCWTEVGQAYELLWSQNEEGHGALVLERVADGERRTLGSVQVPFVPARWYELEARQAQGRIVVSVDGHTLIDTVDPEPLLGGALGLMSRGGAGTVFDDVEVGPFSEVHFDFGRQSAGNRPLLRSSGGGVSRLNVEDGVDVGGILLENARISATLMGLHQVPEDTAVELLVRRSAAGELACRLVHAGGVWKTVLLKRALGGETILADEFAPKPGPEATVSFHVLRDEAWVILDGAMVAHVSGVDVQGQGLCGIRIPPGAGISQRRLHVSPERQLSPVANRVETFTREQSMQNWNSAVLEWNVEYKGERPAYWHRSDFWNDVSAVMDVDALFDVNNPAVLGLALRNPENTAETDAAPAVVSVLHDPAVRQIQLVGLSPEPKVLKLVRQKVTAIGLERRSGRLLARLNGTVIWNEPLPDRLRTLAQIGRYGRGNTEPWAEAVTLRANGMQTYAFKRAPSTWLPASGVWEVTSRWECDPRWSFYSGVKRHGVACNWNKRRHGENVTIEFFAGPRMDQSRGKRYEYAADLNAVICADGKDVTSGYSFMFGGWNDRGSQIVRESTIVGENRRVVIPRESSTHRRWFHVKLRKAGNRLSFWVDGTLVAATTDPEPLAGDRFGLWTWDNGMMVAQFRISTDRPLEAVPPSADALPMPKTPYNP